MNEAGCSQSMRDHNVRCAEPIDTPVQLHKMGDLCRGAYADASSKSVRRRDAYLEQRLANLYDGIIVQHATEHQPRARLVR